MADAIKPNVLLYKRYYGLAPGCVKDVTPEEGRLLVQRGMGEWTDLQPQGGTVIVPQHVIALSEVNGSTQIDWGPR